MSVRVMECRRTKCSAIINITSKALEEDKRTLPGLVIEVGGKSYADAVLQQCSKVEIVKVVAMPHEVIDAKKPTLMKVKPGRKLQFKKHSKSRGKMKEEQIEASISKRVSPIAFEAETDQRTFLSMADDFAISESCETLILNITYGRVHRLPYTNNIKLEEERKVLEPWF